MSCSSAPIRTSSSGRVLRTTAIVWARTSLCRWIGSCSSSMALSSGRNSSARRVRASSHRPSDGSSASSSFDSSSRIRSAEMIAMRPRCCSMAATSAGSGVSPSVATKRAARSIRSGSSVKETSGVSGVRSRPAARSARPSNGSTMAASGSDSAMALTVKSRRERSVSMSSPKATTGLRESGWYTSARKVVISKRAPSLAQPTVPNAWPCSQTASAHPRTIRSTSSGRASVVRSMSSLGRPSTRSRTHPPTR